MTRILIRFQKLTFRSLVAACCLVAVLSVSLAGELHELNEESSTEQVEVEPVELIAETRVAERLLRLQCLTSWVARSANTENAHGRFTRLGRPLSRARDGMNGIGTYLRL